MIEPLTTEDASISSIKKKRRFNPSFIIGVSILFFLVLIAVIGPYFVSFDPFTINPTNRLTEPDTIHYFGTDDFGRDVFIRTLHGTRYSFFIGGIVSLIVTVLGGLIGLLSSASSILDNFFMRIVDGLSAFPAILLSIAIVGIRGASVENVILALVIVYIPEMARIVRSKVLSVKEELYIRSLKLQGASPIRVILVHLLPNILSVVIVQATFIFARSVITEAALSFLGAGIPSPLPSLGNLLFDGKNVIYRAWWLTIFPGLFIVLLIVGLNLAGDGFRDLLDPKTVHHKNRRK